MIETVMLVLGATVAAFLVGRWIGRSEVEGKYQRRWGLETASRMEQQRHEWVKPYAGRIREA